MEVNSMKVIFDDFIERLNLIAKCIASEDIANACLHLGMIIEKCERISDHFDNKEAYQEAKEEIAQGIKERKDILDRLEKLGALFSGRQN